MQRSSTVIHIPARAVTRSVLLCFVAGVSACDLAVPETGFRPSESARAAPYPALLDKDALISAIAPQVLPQVLDIARETLDARAAALRARARALAGPVLPAASAARLQAAGEAAVN